MHIHCAQCNVLSAMCIVYLQSEFQNTIYEFLQFCWSRWTQNKAFVELGSCDNVHTERKIFEYANWRRLQIKRTGRPAGLSIWSILLARPAGQSSWSVQLVYLAGLFSCFTHCITQCILHIASDKLHLTYCILHIASYI